MRLRTKALVDEIVGRPLVAVLNALAYFLGRWMRRDHNVETTRVIVLCKLMGLGSIVQMTPLAASLRQAFPNASIVLLTRNANRPYSELIEVIDRTLTVDDSSIMRLLSSALAALRTLWCLKVDLFINLEVYSNMGALLAVTSCARNRVGYYLQRRDLRAYGIYTHMVYFNQAAPIREVYLQAARTLGIEKIEQGLVAPRLLPEHASSLEKKLPASVAADSGYFVVNPNASDLRIERRWPLHHWGTLLRALGTAYPGIPVFVIGAPGEEGVAAELLRVTGKVAAPLIDISGKLTLGELALLLAGARLFITNDSGPMHIAFSVKTPMVALFGPVAPEHYGGNENGKSIILYRRLYCSPCVHHFLESPCHGNNQCMELITPPEVVVAIEQLLAGEPVDGIDSLHRYRTEKIVFGRQTRAREIT